MNVTTAPATAREPRQTADAVPAGAAIGKRGAGADHRAGDDQLHPAQLA
jgi:hypothetical protein